VVPRRESEAAEGFGRDVPLFVEHCEAVAAAINVKLRWLGEQARRGLSFLSGALPGRHVAQEVACTKAIRRTFGAAAAIQRCQVHKARNIMERLPKSLHPSVRRVLLMRAADSATKRREAADFDSPDPIGAGTSPSGSRTERANLRVETLISIWFMAHLPSQSSPCRGDPGSRRPCHAR